MGTTSLSLPHIQIFSGDPYICFFLLHLGKVFAKENKEVQTMSDASQIAIFTKAESHLGKYLYSSPINKDPQKHIHAYSFSCLFLFLSPHVSVLIVQ